jgi:hypothetical protein
VQCPSSEVFQNYFQNLDLNPPRNLKEENFLLFWEFLILVKIVFITGRSFSTYQFPILMFKKKNLCELFEKTVQNTHINVLGNSWLD